MCTRGCVSMSGDCLGSVDGEQVEGGVQYEEEMHYSCRRDKHVTVTSQPPCWCIRKIHRTQTVKLLKPVLLSRRCMMPRGLRRRGSNGNEGHWCRKFKQKK